MFQISLPKAVSAFALAATLISIVGCASRGTVPTTLSQAQAPSVVPSVDRPNVDFASDAKRFPTAADLYVAVPDTASVAVYSPTSATPIAKISVFNPDSLAFDSSHRLYVASGLYASNPQVISVYQEGRTSPLQTITTGIDCPAGMVIAATWLYVANTGCGSHSTTVTVYSLPSGTLTGTIPIAFPQYLDQPIAVDTTGNLYVASCSAQTVTMYSAGSTTPSRSISFPNDCPWAVAVDSSGYLYVDILGSGRISIPTSSGVGRVVVYPPGSSTPLRTIYPGTLFGTTRRDKRALVSAVALDRSNNIYVQVAKCTEYSPLGCGAALGAVVGYAEHGAKVIRTIRYVGVSRLTPGLAVNTAGTVYLSDFSTVWAYRRGNNNKPWRTLGPFPVI